MNKNMQAVPTLILSLVKVYFNSGLKTITCFHSGSILSKHKEGLLNGKQIILRFFKFLSYFIETKL